MKPLLQATTKKKNDERENVVARRCDANAVKAVILRAKKTKKYEKGFVIARKSGKSVMKAAKRVVEKNVKSGTMKSMMRLLQVKETAKVNNIDFVD